MSNLDTEAKIRLGYTDPGSFVRLDGSEVLFGKDWTRRKEELWERSHGRCEWVVDAGMVEGVIRFYVCGAEAEDPHHVKRRSKGRDDRLSNLMALCRSHHCKVDGRNVQLGRNGECLPCTHPEFAAKIKGDRIKFSNELTDAQLERLAILSEELGEAQQAIGKILRHGYESHNPVAQNGLTNRRELERELGDIDFAIDMLAKAQDVSWAEMKMRRDEKEINIKKYLHHQ